jgi:hypothetical protein
MANACCFIGRLVVQAFDVVFDVFVLVLVLALIYIIHLFLCFLYELDCMVGIE